MSLHAEALGTLRDWPAPDAEQSRMRDRHVAHLRSHPDGLERSCFPEHLTAGVVVLSPALDEVLLNLHRKAGLWLAFGGHCEREDESLAGAALREGLEESGLPTLDLDPVPVEISAHDVDFCDPRGTVVHLDVRFAARAPAGVSHAASDESLDVRWWPLSALPELPDDMPRLIRRARERLGQSTVSSGGGSSCAAADQPSR